jgi:hypothetical protein
MVRSRSYTTGGHFGSSPTVMSSLTSADYAPAPMTTIGHAVGSSHRGAEHAFLSAIQVGPDGLAQVQCLGASQGFGLLQ